MQEFLTDRSVTEDIKNKNYTKCYLFCGNDGYLKKFYSDKLIDSIVDREDVFSFHSFDNSSDLQDVYDAAMQVSLISDKNCILLTDFNFEKCDKNSFEKLIGIIKEIGDDTVLILNYLFCDFDLKGEKFKKISSVIEKNGGKIIKIDHRTSGELVKIIMNAAQKRNCTISRGDAEYLINTVSDDFSIIKNEVEKLCNYTVSGNITRETVDKVCIKSIDESIYNLAEAIISSDVAKAQTMLNNLFFMRVEPLQILSVISSAYIDLKRVSAAQESGQSIQAAVSDFGYGKRAFVLNKAQRNLKNTDSKEIDKAIEILSEADSAIKSYASDENIVLEKLIVDLIQVKNIDNS